MSIRDRIKQLLNSIEDSHHQDILRAADQADAQETDQQERPERMHEDPLVDIVELGDLRMQGVVTLFPVCTQRRIVSVHETFGAASSAVLDKRGELLAIRKIEFKIDELHTA